MRFFKHKVFEKGNRIAAALACGILAVIMLVTPAFAAAVRIDLPWLKVPHTGEEFAAGYARIVDGELEVFYKVDNNGIGHFYTTADCNHVLQGFGIGTNDRTYGTTFWSGDMYYWAGGGYKGSSKYASALLSKNNSSFSNLMGVCLNYNGTSAYQKKDDREGYGYWIADPNNPNGNGTWTTFGVNDGSGRTYTNDDCDKTTITKLTVYMLSTYNADTAVSDVIDNDGASVRNPLANHEYEWYRIPQLEVKRYDTSTSMPLVSANTKTITIGTASGVLSNDVIIDNRSTISNAVAIQAGNGIDLYASTFTNSKSSVGTSFGTAIKAKSGMVNINSALLTFNNNTTDIELEKNDSSTKSLMIVRNTAVTFTNTNIYKVNLTTGTGSWGVGMYVAQNTTQAHLTSNFSFNRQDVKHVNENSVDYFKIPGNKIKSIAPGTNNETWYQTFKEANESAPTGSTLVWFGDTTDSEAFTVSKNFTLRCAASGDTMADGSPYSGGNRTATITAGFTVASGYSLTLGNGAGDTLTLNGGGTPNYLITNNGTITYNSKVTLQNAGKTAIYQDGTLNLSGSPSFSAGTDVYLPANKTIKKSGTLTNSNAIKVTIQEANPAQKRVIFEKGTADVVSGDEQKFTLQNNYVSSNQGGVVFHNYDNANTSDDKVVIMYGTFSVVLSNGVGTKTHNMKDLPANGRYDLTKDVDAGYLYSGWFTDSSYDTVRTQNEPGNNMIPAVNGTYYVKQVSDKFLGVKNLVNYDSSRRVQKYFMLSAVDSLKYSYTGFYVKIDNIHEDTDDERYKSPQGETSRAAGTKVYTSIKVSASNTYTPSTVFSGTNGVITDSNYLMAVPLTYRNSPITYGHTYSFVPYWVTLDNVKVYGKTTRSFTLAEFYPDRTSIVNSDITGDSITSSDTRVNNPQSMTTGAGYGAYSGSGDDGIVYVLKKNEKDRVDYQQMHLGDNTAIITHNDIPGSSFIGWYSDANFTNEADFSEISDDMEVYARYISDEDLQYSLTEQGNGNYSVSVILPEAINELGNVSFIMTTGNGEVVLPADSMTRLQSIINALFTAQNGKTYRLSAYTANINTNDITGGSLVSVNVRWTAGDGNIINSNAMNYRYLFKKLWRV